MSGLFVFCGLLSPAAGNSKYAAVVIHADTGDILFDKYSTQKRYPASLTKMMTLYLLFEELEAGRLTMQSQLKVSRNAAAQPASKLGIKAGSTITVEKAIQALIVKSANDVATCVAENISGSETKFARKMTNRAWAMGMKSTRFRNASGLTHRKQYSSARDLAVLSQRVVQDFPQYWPYFQLQSFTYKGKTYKSHNKLVGSFDGADGLKTGYTRLSGYNLATTIERGDDRLIGIVLGGRSGYTRDRHMKDILNNAHAAIVVNPQLVSAVHRIKPTPSLKPTRLAELGGVWPPAEMQAQALTMASAEMVNIDSLSLAAAAPTIGGDAALKLELAGLATDGNWTGAPSGLPLEDDLGSLISASGAEGLNQRALLAAARETEIGEGDIDTDIIPADRAWSIQTGAYRDRSYAELEMADARDLIAPLAASARQQIIVGESKGLPLYRVRFTRLTESEAEKSCAAVIAEGGDCYSMRDRDISDK